MKSAIYAILGLALIMLISGCDELAGQAFKIVSKHGCTEGDTISCKGKVLVTSHIDSACKISVTKVDCPYACMNSACMSEDEYNELMAKSKVNKGGRNVECEEKYGDGFQCVSDLAAFTSECTAAGGTVTSYCAEADLVCKPGNNKITGALTFRTADSKTTSNSKTATLAVSSPSPAQMASVAEKTASSVNYVNPAAVASGDIKYSPNSESPDVIAARSPSPAQMASVAEKTASSVNYVNPAAVASGDIKYSPNSGSPSAPSGSGAVYGPSSPAPSAGSRETSSSGQGKGSSSSKNSGCCARCVITTSSASPQGGGGSPSAPPAEGGTRVDESVLAARGINPEPVLSCPAGYTCEADRDAAARVCAVESKGTVDCGGGICMGGTCCKCNALKEPDTPGSCTSPYSCMTATEKTNAESSCRTIQGLQCTGSCALYRGSTGSCCYCGSSLPSCTSGECVLDSDKAAKQSACIAANSDWSCSGSCTGGSCCSCSAKSHQIVNIGSIIDAGTVPKLGSINVGLIQEAAGMTTCPSGSECISSSAQSSKTCVGIKSCTGTCQINSRSTGCCYSCTPSNRFSGTAVLDVSEYTACSVYGSAYKCYATEWDWSYKCSGTGKKVSNSICITNSDASGFCATC
jgi:hypothetical protein